ncbi:sugar phosphate isomerase/epimerase family protein [Arthrobacter sp. R-11]|uniref:sugar phosphate isomerase/epimerase family protein n=1 Tax=Arthrobacter sp. R-11 TaxID=3404053 RepID=UPI003CEDB935
MSLSVQLYSVRDAVESDLGGTLERLAGIGLTQVEPYNFAATVDALEEGLKSAGLTAPTGHAPLLSSDQDEIFAAAKRLGIGTVIDPFTLPEEWQTEESVRSIAERVNAAAKKGAQYGLRVGYHNHYWEVASTINGVTALEFFAGLLDPEVVLEVDTYWVAAGGQDPVEYLKKFGDRVVAIHVKDGPITQFPGDRFDVEELGKVTATQLPAGEGELDIRSIIKAPSALEVGVIEFDAYGGDIFEGIAASFAYLTAGDTTGEAAGTEAAAK